MSHHASGPNFGFPRGDARLDMTDLYAFPKPGEPDKSIIIFNMHPSMAVNPMGPTTREPFAPGALYEIKVDTDGDAIADVCCSAQFAASEDGTQTATLRRIQGTRAAGVCDAGDVIVEGAPVSVDRDALVTKAGDYRVFFGWRSDPFFFDAKGLSTRCSSRATISSRTRMFAASCLNCPTRLWGATRWDFGLAPWTKLEKAGSRQTGVQGQSKRFSSQARRGSRTSRGSQRMMIGLLVSSHMNWNTPAAIRRRRQWAWRESCCQTFFPMTLAARHPFRTMAGHSPTMLSMFSSLYSRTEK